MTNEIYPENNPSNSQPNNLPKIYIPVILIALICFLLISVSFFAFCLYNQNLKLQKAILPSQTQNTNSLISLPTSIPSQISTAKPTSSSQFDSIIWFDKPKKIKFLPIFRDNGKEAFSINEENGAEFYEVASFSNGDKLIDGRIHFEGPGDYVLIRFIDSNGKYSLVTTGIDQYSKEEILNQIIPSVKIIELKLSDLESPETFTNIKPNLSKLYETSKFINEIKNTSKLFDSPFGPVYESIDLKANEIPEISTKKFFLKLKDGIVTQYQLPVSKETNFFTGIIWSDGKKNNVNFNQNIVFGCGIGSVGVPFIAQNSTLVINKREIGRTAKNQPVYQLTDSNNPLVREFYKVYKDTRNIGDSSVKIISFEEYTNSKSYFLWQDEQGDYQIFLSDDFAPLVECGKPVIYLYPEKETNINVQVGAKISKSEPLYPQKGWTVLAKPNGELIYQGKTYSNLFWEGLGNGTYPNYKKYGVVIEQKNLISVLKNQLKQLGLNSQEASDFIDFWQTKLPQSPFVRLTWLNTKDMDELAPISVFPKPDTKIRVFLEFEGLDKPEKLISQKLSSIPRNGFTLIEWGGLLIK